MNTEIFRRALNTLTEMVDYIRGNPTSDAISSLQSALSIAKELDLVFAEGDELMSEEEAAKKS